MLQRYQAVGNTASDLTGPRFEPQTFRSRDERVTARPTGKLGQIENESGKTLHAKATTLRDRSRGHLPEPTRKNGRNTVSTIAWFQQRY